MNPLSGWFDPETSAWLCACVCCGDATTTPGLCPACREEVRADMERTTLEDQANEDYAHAQGDDEIWL